MAKETKIYPYTLKLFEKIISLIKLPIFNELLKWTPSLCLGFVLFDMILVNTFIIAMHGVMNYSLLMSNLFAFYAKLHEIQKIEFHFAFEVSFSIYF